MELDGLSPDTDWRAISGQLAEIVTANQAGNSEPLTRDFVETKIATQWADRNSDAALD